MWSKVLRIFTQNTRQNCLNTLRPSRSCSHSTQVNRPCRLSNNKYVVAPEISNISWSTSGLKLSNPLNERLNKISPGLPGRIFELPRPSLTSVIMDLPPTMTSVPLESPFQPSREAPGTGTVEKQAARLIVIRRRKMKKHKLKKLRKRMKFEWAKVRQKREMRKEKAFQAILLTQIREAEKFDAEAYVTEKLRKSKEVPLPRTWKGRRLPEFLIKEKLGIK